ncbi:hypothetical protein EVAR_75916_1 [Eumeta japonica]|uniref:Uncharacterized protein n=1 Tax=Eumeta variegata TaxID=151549 RepID=A0A4C1UW25_EUMVA|nr:hypothetical protein EVAR_75916_1 [Eumeta japonica]
MREISSVHLLVYSWLQVAVAVIRMAAYYNKTIKGLADSIAETHPPRGGRRDSTAAGAGAGPSTAAGRRSCARRPTAADFHMGRFGRNIIGHVSVAGLVFNIANLVIPTRPYNLEATSLWARRLRRAAVGRRRLVTKIILPVPLRSYRSPRAPGDGEIARLVAGVRCDFSEDNYECCARGRPIIVEWERRKAFGGPLSFESSVIERRRRFRGALTRRLSPSGRAAVADARAARAAEGISGTRGPRLRLLQRKEILSRS